MINTKEKNKLILLDNALKKIDKHRINKFKDITVMEVILLIESSQKGKDFIMRYLPEILRTGEKEFNVNKLTSNEDAILITKRQQIIGVILRATLQEGKAPEDLFFKLKDKNRILLLRELLKINKNTVEKIITLDSKAVFYQKSTKLDVRQVSFFEDEERRQLIHNDKNHKGKKLVDRNLLELLLKDMILFDCEASVVEVISSKIEENFLKNNVKKILEGSKDYWNNQKLYCHATLHRKK